jgi:hypothetical protein
MKTAVTSTMRLGAEGIKVLYQVVWVELKWHVPKLIKKDVFHCIP